MVLTHLISIIICKRLSVVNLGFGDTGTYHWQVFNSIHADRCPVSLTNALSLLT